MKPSSSPGELDSGYLKGVAAAGSNDYFALLFCPSDMREGLRLLLAFERLLNQLSFETMDPDVRRAKLGWWAEELMRMSNAQPVHPVTIAINQLVAARKLALKPVFDFFSALTREAADDLPETPEAILSHASDRGALLALCAQFLLRGEALSEGGHSACSAVGSARFLSTILAGGHDAHLKNKAAAEESSTHAISVEAKLAARQREILVSALHKMPADERPALVPVLVWAKLSHDDLATAQRGLPARRRPLRRLFTAWNSARRAARGKMPV